MVQKSRTIIRPRLMEYMAKSPGVQHYVGDIIRELGATELKVRDCMSGLIRQNSMPGLMVTIPGRAWVYRPPADSAAPAPKTEKRMFEEIGQAKDGIVIQDEAGKLYLAKEL